MNKILTLVTFFLCTTLLFSENFNEIKSGISVSSSDKYFIKDVKVIDKIIYFLVVDNESCKTNVYAKYNDPIMPQTYFSDS